MAYYSMYSFSNVTLLNIKNGKYLWRNKCVQVYTSKYFWKIKIFDNIFSSATIWKHTCETKVIEYSILHKELLTASFHILVSIMLSTKRFHFNWVFVPTEWLITCKNSCKLKEITCKTVTCKNISLLGGEEWEEQGEF